MQKTSRDTATTSIAILPFISLSTDQANEYFCDGLTEEIINALTKIEGLQVTARHSSFLFKNTKPDIQLIGDQLGVANILRGSVQFVESKVRISVQLIEVESGFHLWSATFDRSLDDIFALQDEVSLLIADKLREQWGHLEIADHLIAHPSIDAATYHTYLRGRYCIQKFNKPDVEKGIAILKSLTEKKPDFSLPYLSLNYAYTYLAALGMMPIKEAILAGKLALDKAIDLDSTLPECQLRLAGVSFWQEWDFPKTYTYLNQALEMQPGNAEAHLWTGVVLVAAGKFEAAQPYFDKALALDPFSTLILDFKGAYHYFKEEYDLATYYFNRCLSSDPNFLMSHINLAATELMLGKLEAGLHRFQNLPPSGTSDLSKLGGTTLAFALLNEFPKVEKGLQLLEKALESDVMDRALFFLIMINTTIQRYDIALNWLEIGIKKRVAILITFNIEPFLKPLRTLQRYKELMRPIFQNSQPQSPLLKKQYKSSWFSKEVSLTYFKQLQTIMEATRPYLNKDLTLRSLAQLMELHPNYLSRLINEHTEDNFASYINSYRLETFKSKVKDPANNHLTILALAYESGFSSKTVFNTYFKKRMGITPKMYVNNQLN